MFRLKLNLDLPKNSFIFNGKPYDVPCCFQIWEKSKRKRSIKKIDLNNEYFEFVNKSKANIAVKRVGGRAGKANLDIKNATISSNYFLKLKSNIDINNFIEIINSIDYSLLSESTVAVKSLSKSEFALALIKGLNKYVKSNAWKKNFC